MFRDVRARVPGADRVVLSAHCHDDLGLAVANSLAAIAAGARQVECTVNGIGERAGNAALEEMVMASQVRGAALGFRCNVESREIYRTSQLLSYLTGVFPQPNKAIVGPQRLRPRGRDPPAWHAAERAHLRDHPARDGRHPALHAGAGQALRPARAGAALSRAGLRARPSTQLAEVYRQFTALADRKREILDEDLLALVHESFHDAPEEYQLTHLRVVCGSVTPTAEVRMTGPWAGERSARGTGDGPIAAAFTAISEILGRPIEVLSLSLRSLTPGRDSVGQVFLQAKIDGKSLSGHGASTDIVEASARALVHALNKAHHAERLEASSLNSVYLWGV